jgi:hypothetical protein
MSAYLDKTDNINENNLNAGTPIDDGETYKKPTSLFGALSIIQRYFVIESRSPEDLPKEYFTFEQVWDFLKVGFKSGFIESFFLVTLLPLLQTIYPSFKLFFFNEKLSNIEFFLLQSISFLPIFITTLFLIYLSKYYKGSVTKKAIFSLFLGRSFAFLFKGIIIYYILNYLYKISYKTPNTIYSVLDFFKFIFNLFLPYKVNINVIYDYYYKFIAPAIKQTAIEIFATMFLFAILPFITIFLKGLILKKRQLSAMKQYENY